MDDCFNINFYCFSECIYTTGLNTALIQKKDVDEKDYSTVFYASLGVAGFLYVILFLLLLLLQAFMIRIYLYLF